MGVLIKTNGVLEPLIPKNGTDFSLEELQEAVGGYIELVTVEVDREIYYLVVNENGCAESLDLNPIASRFYRGGIIVGNALVCRCYEIK